MTISRHHLAVLRKIHDALQESSVVWALTGSCGMVLQGMDLPVHDIDIQTDEDGAYEIERRLAKYVLKPVLYKRSEQMRSRLGVLGVDGLQVEVIGALQKRLPDGGWEEPVQVADHRVWLELEDLKIPVLSLEHEAEAYRLMGREERASEIEAWLRKHRRR